MADEAREEAGMSLDVRDQLALATLACALMSLAMGMLPDSLAPAAYRTATWLLFALFALMCAYLAFPHMWPYALWLAGVYAGAALGLTLIAGRADELLGSRPAAIAIGALLELAALTLVYNLLLRVRTARAVLGSTSPLGIWLLAALGFFALSNLAGAGWLAWSAGGSGAALAVYAASEALLALLLVYICWAPERLVWQARRTAHITTVEAPARPLVRRLVGRKETALRSCPACGAPLRSLSLRCPSCEAGATAGWCAAHESFLAPCPSCGAPTLSHERSCIKCGAPFPGLMCPSCGKASPVREWRRSAP